MTVLLCCRFDIFTLFTTTCTPLDDFEAIAQQDAYWLSRYKVGTTVCDLKGQAIDLASWLPQHIGDTLDTQVLLGKSKQLPCRLVAERVPLWVVRQRHERLHETARQNQTSVSQRALVMAHWTIYVIDMMEIKATPRCSHPCGSALIKQIGGCDICIPH